MWPLIGWLVALWGACRCDGAFAPAGVLDLTATDPALIAFHGGFIDGTYGYAMPSAGFGKVARFDLAGFATVAVLDLKDTDPALKIFIGGFTDGTYGYAIPSYYDGVAIVGKVARFDLAGFATVAVLDLTATDPALQGFQGGFTDGTYGYAIPWFNGAFAGIARKVARFDLAGFAAVASLDLTAIDPALQGLCRGGVADGTYGYTMPYRGSGKVARFDLAGFATVAVLDLADTDPDHEGFDGGFTDGTYGYAMPQLRFWGPAKVARFDLAGFATVAGLDLTDTDPHLHGFVGGFTDGTYGYAIPNSNGARFGKVARFDLAGFATVAVLDLTATDPALQGFIGGFTDGTYGYAIPHVSGKVARFAVHTTTTPTLQVTATTATATLTSSTLTTTTSCYVDGPRVPSNVDLCGSSALGSLEDMVSLCDGAPGCAFLHNVNCDGVNWRPCFADLKTTRDSGGGTSACTKVNVCRTTTYTATSATETSATATATTATATTTSATTTSGTMTVSTTWTAYTRTTTVTSTSTGTSTSVTGTTATSHSSSH